MILLIVPYLLGTFLFVDLSIWTKSNIISILLQLFYLDNWIHQTSNIIYKSYILFEMSDTSASQPQAAEHLEDLFAVFVTATVPSTVSQLSFYASGLILTKALVP